MSPPLISVIVPVYMVEKYIDKCVDSILEQTYEDFELLLVDDGSPDKSGCICDNYALKDNRIKAIHQTNSGPGTAIKRGVIESSGKWLLFVDSDDWIENDMLERLYGIANRTGVDIVLCHAVRECADHMETIRLHGLEDRRYTKDDMKSAVYPRLINNGTIDGKIIVGSRWGKLFRRELILSSLRYYQKEMTHGEDWLLSLPAILDANAIYAMDDYYPYHYRHNPNSISESYSDNLFPQWVVLLTHVENIVKEKSVFDFSLQIERCLQGYAVSSVCEEMKRLGIDEGKVIVTKIGAICSSNELKRIRVAWCLPKASLIHKILLFLIQCDLPTVLFYFLAAIGIMGQWKRRHYSAVKSRTC